MLTVSQAAEALGLSESRVRALIKSGKLVAEKRGRQWMIFERSVEERNSSVIHVGRPHVESSRTESRHDAITPAYSLFCECKEAFAHGLAPELLSEAKTDEERDFYVQMFNFFLARKCDELVEQGIY